jgi:hypothetical protein
MERQVGEDQFRAVADERISSSSVSARAMSQPISFAPAARATDRAEITGAIHDHRVAGIDQAAREQIEPLLRAPEKTSTLSRGTL